MRRYLLVAVALLTLAGTDFCQAQGIYLPAFGPVNRAMGGAAVAAPLDAIGALYWNPATISALPESQLDVSMGFLMPEYQVHSAIPGVGSGLTETEPGVSPLFNAGWVHQLPNERLRLGFGIHTAAGYFANTPADPTNPLLAPPPNGFGRFSGSAQFFQMTPTISYLVSDRWSVAVSPIFSMGLFTSNFSPFVTPNANGLYPAGDGSRYSWGGGIQLGTFYILNDCWRFGASLRSPVLHEKFRYFSTDENGLPRQFETNFDLPLIASLGTSYSPTERTLIAFDARFIDNHNAEGFGEPARFQADGSLGGLGWNSQMSFAVGVQHKVTECFYARAGYMYCTRLIDSEDAAFNVPGTNLSYRHLPSIGGSLKLGPNVAASIAYSYAPEAKISGPIYLPNNVAIPGSVAENVLSAHALEFGVSVSY